MKKVGSADAPSSDWLFPEGTGPGPATVFPKRQIAEMHRRFRSNKDGRKCGECTFFGRWQHNTKAYSKCDIFGHTGGPGSDWNRKWPACGAFREPEPAPPGETPAEYMKRRWAQRDAVARRGF